MRRLKNALMSKQNQRESRPHSAGIFRLSGVGASVHLTREPFKICVFLSCLKAFLRSTSVEILLMCLPVYSGSISTQSLAFQGKRVSNQRKPTDARVRGVIVGVPLHGFTNIHLYINVTFSVFHFSFVYPVAAEICKLIDPLVKKTHLGDEKVYCTNERKYSSNNLEKG